MPNIPSIKPLGTEAAQQTRGAEQSAIKKNSGIDMDDFLKILAATMSNPSMGGESGGGGNNDHISQLVQFTTLEQLETLGTNLENTMMMTQQQQAMSMIDKEVTLISDKGEEIKGKVERIKFLGGTPTIIVDGKEYSMGNIAELGK